MEQPCNGTVQSIKMRFKEVSTGKRKDIPVTCGLATGLYPTLYTAAISLNAIQMQLLQYIFSQAASIHENAQILESTTTQ